MGTTLAAPGAPLPGRAGVVGMIGNFMKNDKNMALASLSCSW